MRGHDFFVYLNDTVAEEWKGILKPERGRQLPVTTPIPILAILPGFDVPQRVFLLALDQMERSELDAIAAKLAGKFDLKPSKALTEIRKAGIPIREEHTSTVIVHNPQRWF
jgi:hypothetical protein